VAVDFVKEMNDESGNIMWVDIIRPENSGKLYRLSKNATGDWQQTLILDKQVGFQNTDLYGNTILLTDYDEDRGIGKPHHYKTDTEIQQLSEQKIKYGAYIEEEDGGVLYAIVPCNNTMDCLGYLKEGFTEIELVDGVLDASISWLRPINGRIAINGSSKGWALRVIDGDHEIAQVANDRFWGPIFLDYSSNELFPCYVAEWQDDESVEVLLVHGPEDSTSILTEVTNIRWHFERDTLEIDELALITKDDTLWRAIFDIDNGELDALIEIDNNIEDSHINDNCIAYIKREGF
jgi:hypothetical protein